jgi:putative transposase
MLRATKVRVYPTPEQAEFRKSAVWRRAIRVQQGARDQEPPLSRLAGFDGHSLQQACLNLDRAFTNFFEGRARFPRFRHKHGSQSNAA